MKLKEEWWEADQAELQQKNDLVDDAIRSGTNAKPGTSSEGFYTPREGIKYQSR